MSGAVQWLLDLKSSAARLECQVVECSHPEWLHCRATFVLGRSLTVSFFEAKELLDSLLAHVAVR
eukprot:9911505-Ditylum_brightwellii.AAC.1